MTATRKRQLKKRFKVLTRLSYLTILAFFFFLTTIFIIRAHFTADWNSPYIMMGLMAIILSPIFSGMVMTMIAGNIQRELLQYKFNIKCYRTRNFAVTIINLLQRNKLKEAIDLYKANKFPEKSLDDYLYGMIIMACYTSTDEKIAEIGIRKITKLKEDFNPSKLKL